jgi:nitrous oxide reductase accessory protein NosL
MRLTTFSMCHSNYEQGEPDFFCGTAEMFAIYLRPEQKKRVVALFTQDMGKADRVKPQGHWVDARSEFYVAGSKQPRVEIARIRQPETAEQRRMISREPILSPFVNSMR